jgi:hypothetical protein
MISNSSKSLSMWTQRITKGQSATFSGKMLKLFFSEYFFVELFCSTFHVFSSPMATVPLPFTMKSQLHEKAGAVS